MVGTGRSAELFGRADAARRVSAVVEASLVGTPRHAIVAGEAGVGKTRLLAYQRDQATTGGARVLAGHAVAVGANGLPFAPYTEILLTLVAEDGVQRVRAAAGRASDELARLLPALGAKASDASGPVHAETRLYQALLQLLRGLALESPLVIQLEDLHWADPGTLAATLFAMRSLGDAPISIAATYRTDQAPSTALRSWVAEVSRADLAERIDLGPLDADATEALVRSVAGPDITAAEIDRIHRRSNGNPFFVEQLIAARDDLGVALPSQLRDVLLARVDVLSEPARRLLEVASVGGNELRHEALRRVARLEDGSSERQLRELVGAALLVPVQTSDGIDAYVFRHALVHEAVYGSLLPTERRRLHLAWAEALTADDDAATASTSSLVEIAYHWREARDPRALEASILAGDRAMQSFSFTSAADEYEAALLLWNPETRPARGIEHVDMLIRYGRAAYYSKRDREAVAAFRAALDEDTDSARRSLIQGRLARSLWALGEWTSATEAYEAALESAPADPPEARTRALAGLAQTHMANGQFRRSIPLAEQALEQARAMGDRQLEGSVLNTMGMDLAWLGHTAASRDAFDAALEIARELEDPDDIGRAYVNRIATLPLGGKSDDALAEVDEALEVARGMGTTLSYGPYVHIAATYAAFQAGLWDLAIEHLGQADRLVPAEQMGPYRACNVLHLLAERGDPRAHATWEESRERMNEMPPSNFLVQLHTGAVALATHEDRLSEAARTAIDGIAVAERTDAWIRSSELARVAAWPFAELAIRARRDRRVADLGAALESLERLSALAERAVADLGQPQGPLGERLRLDREHVRAERDRANDVRTTEVWLSIADGWVDADRPHRALYPRWRATLGALADGDRATAIGQLRAGHAAARSMGALPMLGRLERTARQLRVHLDDDARDDAAAAQQRPYGLTPRELEVLALLVAGNTNQEIADSLYVSKSTAGVHVSNIIGKLDVASRKDAADLAVDEKLV